VSPEIGKVLGDFDLRLAEDFLEMADAQFTGLEQIEDAQARRVAQALVNPDEVHGQCMP
jgi:hypothetical protein